MVLSWKAEEQNELFTRKTYKKIVMLFAKQSIEHKPTMLKTLEKINF